MADSAAGLGDVSQMSGQKYKRTNFEEDDNSLADGTPPGGSYDPAIAFKVGATFCHRRSPLERLLLALVAILALVALVLAVLLGSHNHPSSDDAKQPPHSPSQSKGKQTYRSYLQVTNFL